MYTLSVDGVHSVDSQGVGGEGVATWGDMYTLSVDGVPSVDRQGVGGEGEDTW